MDTISKIQDKINTLLENDRVRALVHAFFILLLMGISFLLGVLSQPVSTHSSSSGIAIYLPNGELLTQKTLLNDQSTLSQYIIGGAQNSVIPENGPTLSDRLALIEQAPDSTKKTTAIFGSKNGSTYYTPGCKSGDRVKVENRVYFETEASAEDEGYTKSKLCK